MDLSDGYPFSHNRGSGKLPQMKGNYYWRDPADMQHSQHCLQIQLPWQLPALPALGLLVVLLPLHHLIPRHPSKIVVKSKRPEYPELSVQEALREIFTQISH